MFNTKIKKLFICLTVMAVIGLSLFFVSQVLAADSQGDKRQHEDSGGGGESV